MRPRTKASSSCPTFAVCTASTRSSHSASPNAASPRPRSTTSVAPPASPSATTTSRTWITSAATDPATIQLDVAAAAAWLRDHGAGSIFTVGFCFGGRNSWLSTADGHDLAGAVGFYGSLTARGDWPGPLDRAAELKGPILALQAGADENITSEQNAAFDEALSAAGVEHEVVTYEGAPHSFFDRKQEQYQAASDDAWKRTLAFIERHA